MSKVRMNPWRMFSGAFIPNCVMKYNGISPSAKLMWARLAQFAGENGACYPSQEVLQQELNVSERTCKRLVSELVKDKFIEVEKPTGSDLRNGKNNVYHFLMHPVFTGAISGPCTGATDGPCTGAKSCNSPTIDNLVVTSKTESKVRESLIKDPTGSSGDKSRNKREKALESLEGFKAYMKLDETLSRRPPEMTAKDFVVLIYCASAKYEGKPFSLPTWPKETAFMKKMIQKYGHQQLYDIIVALCRYKEDVAEVCKQDYRIGIPAMYKAWVVDAAQQVAHDKVSKAARSLKQSQNKAMELAKQSAEERMNMYRSKINANKS